MMMTDLVFGSSPGISRVSKISFSAFLRRKIPVWTEDTRVSDDDGDDDDDDDDGLLPCLLEL